MACYNDHQLLVAGAAHMHACSSRFAHMFLASHSCVTHGFFASTRYLVGELYRTIADPNNLQGKQLAAYNIVKHHMESNDCGPLHMIISGTAGTGKSYLIHCLRILLSEKVHVVVPTGLQHMMSMVVLCILFSVYQIILYCGSSANELL